MARLVLAVGVVILLALGAWLARRVEGNPSCGPGPARNPRRHSAAPAPLVQRVEPARSGLVPASFAPLGHTRHDLPEVTAPWPPSVRDLVHSIRHGRPPLSQWSSLLMGTEGHLAWRPALSSHLSPAAVFGDGTPRPRRSPPPAQEQPSQRHPFRDCSRRRFPHLPPHAWAWAPPVNAVPPPGPVPRDRSPDACAASAPAHTDAPVYG
jgi:hypothetical protein